MTAFALDLTDPALAPTQAILPTCITDAHRIHGARTFGVLSDGLVVNVQTGEILSIDDKPSLFATPGDYKLIGPDKSSFADVWMLDPDADRKVNDRIGTPEDDEAEPDAPRKSAAGRKPRIVHNDWALHIQAAQDMEAPWLGDYIYGACYVCAGSNNGKLNVSPGDVCRVAMLPTFSTKGVQAVIRNHKSLPVSKRQAQRLVQVAAFSLEGVQMYWDRNPDALSRLAARVAELEAEEMDDAAFAAAYYKGIVYEGPKAAVAEVEAIPDELLQLASDKSKSNVTWLDFSKKVYEHYSAMQVAA